jgi:type IV pilus assembly protein PilM
MFGLDIGSQTVKAMQLELHTNNALVKAYGSIETDEKIMKDGVITNIPEAAKTIDKLLSEQLSGNLTTNRVVMGVPVSHVFTRVLTLPLMSKSELDSAIQLEVEQSVPIPSKNLYFDYETTDSGNPDTMLVRMVASPKSIVDSYTAVCDLLKLDLALVQTNIRADAQLCLSYEDLIPGNPYIIVDVGGNSIDVGILDATLRVTGTVDEGGNSLTAAIAKELKISEAKAHNMKVTHGLNAGKSQAKILKAVDPILQKVTTEIKRMSRFYQERIKEDAEISQILIFGGGANMPGFGEYLTDATRIPTRVSSPWGRQVSFGKIEPPERSDLPRFLTCAGLAMAREDEALGV